MPTLTATPSQPNVGQAVLITGDGYDEGGTVTVEVGEEGLQTEIVADASGAFGTTDIADHATTTLTISGDDFVADDTIAIGALTYTIKAAPTTVARQVKLGADANATLQNLKDAINLTGTPGTQYGSLTTLHTTVFAGDIDTDDHTLKLHAKTGGTGGNALASTVTTIKSPAFPGATFNSGTPGTSSTGISAMIWHPTHPGTFDISASDGTNEATLAVQVWEGT